MKRFSRLLIVLALTGIAFQTFGFSVFAYTLSSASGTKTAGATETITLSAVPQANESGVKFDLVFTNATVIGFTPPSSSTFITLPECSGSVFFTSSTICATAAKISGNLTSGEALGSFQVTWGSVGTATITATDNNLYLTSTSQRVDSGVKGTYTISTATTNTPTPTPTQSTLPSTPLTDKAVDQYILMLSGVCLILLGFYLRRKVHAGANI